MSSDYYQDTPAGTAVDRLSTCPFCSGGLYIRYRLDKDDNQNLLETIYIFCTRCDREYMRETYISDTDDYNQLIRNYNINTEYALEKFYKTNNNFVDGSTHKNKTFLLHSTDELLDYLQSQPQYIYSIEKNAYKDTELHLNIKHFSREVNFYEGWFEKTYNLSCTRIYENGEERYQTSKKDIDKAVETFKKDLEKHEAGSRTIKNRIKNDSRIQAWIASIIITALLLMIGTFNELSFNEKKNILLTFIFIYSIIALATAFICNHVDGVKNYQKFPMWFYIAHWIIAAPFILYAASRYL